MWWFASYSRLWGARDVLRVRWSTSWQVSSHGRVQSSTGIISFGSHHASGYRAVCIRGQTYYVHRLVAAAFLSAPPGSDCWQVNHVDRDRANNRVANLQYVTQSENSRHSHANDFSRESGASKMGKNVLWRRVGEGAWTFCNTQSEAARLLCISRKGISQCCIGKRRTCRGNGTWYEFRDAAKRLAPLPGEIWKPARYPGEPSNIFNLAVSNHGRISQMRHGFENAHFGTRTRAGYYVVARRSMYMLVHRPVAATFLGQPACPDDQVNHKDSDKGNNHVHNLEYLTASENVKHSWRHGVRDVRKVPNCKSVQARSTTPCSKGPWQNFESVKAAAAHTGVKYHRVSRICRGLDTGRSTSWEFKFKVEAQLPGEEWRVVVLEGAKKPANSPS